jgi:hypothetical protein
MVETAMLSELDIKRRERESELASLSQKEMILKYDLRKLEEKVIFQLEETIKAKKLTLRDLESRKNFLEMKLREMQGNPVVLQRPVEQCVNSKGGEPVQQDLTEEDYVEATLVEGYKQQIEETGRGTKKDKKDPSFF